MVTVSNTGKTSVLLVGLDTHQAAAEPGPRAIGMAIQCLNESCIYVTTCIHVDCRRASTVVDYLLGVGDASWYDEKEKHGTWLSRAGILREAGVMTRSRAVEPRCRPPQVQSPCLV